MKTIIIALILLLSIILPHASNAATHEMGIGVSVLNVNSSLNSDFGFNLYYDYSPIKFLIIKSEISGQFFDNILSTSTRDTYWDDFYLNRESLSERPQNSDYCYSFSYEESILYKTTLGKFKPFIGIGIGYHILSNSVNIFVSDKSQIYSLGYNIRGGFKYPIGPKLFTSIEAKYTYTNYSNDNINYRSQLGGGALVIQQYSTNEIPNLNRLVVHAGLSFRL
ncbi:MAG: hypothetical protein GY865_02885 [candidate division Zixibacteria bacterium]|nr:hypothetical protein [candidate division Zixibacteria bacterium]